MKFLGIILLAVGASVLYGILHDQITVRVCLEYFTVGHPMIIESESPTLLAIAWGIVATWWMGLLLGLPLALCCCAGPAPAIGPRELLKPVAYLLLLMATLALISGIAGFQAARSGMVTLLPSLADRIPPARHAAFIADLWAHLASYASGFLGGVVLCARSVVLRQRQWRSRRESHPLPPP